MEVRFWGNRGSLPASIKTENIVEKIKSALGIALHKGLNSESNIDSFVDKEFPFWIRGTYGSNTSCVEIREGNDFLLCDAGTGLRDFGNFCINNSDDDQPDDFHILISHPHWDHIQGFPFFSPAYNKGTRIFLYGCHEALQEAFSIQQSKPFFPVLFKDINAECRFVSMTPGKAYDIAGFKVTSKAQNHPGTSFGYRFERHGKCIVYSTDSEYKSESDKETASFVDFISQADLLIYDAQYTFADACTIKEDWGHSNNLVGVELAQRAGVKHLCLFHHEPTSSDKDLDQLLSDTKRLASIFKGDNPPRISIAWEGMTIDI